MRHQLHILITNNFGDRYLETEQNIKTLILQKKNPIIYTKQNKQG